MIFVAISKPAPGFSMEAVVPMLPAEAQAAWDLHKNGQVFAIHFDQVATRGILMLDVASREEIPAILQTLPLVAEGLIDFDIFHLGPFGGLEALFANAG